MRKFLLTLLILLSFTSLFASTYHIPFRFKINRPVEEYINVFFVEAGKEAAISSFEINTDDSYANTTQVQLIASTNTKKNYC